MSTSPIRQVLVHLDPGGGIAGRLTAARRIAQQHGAELTALYACMPAFLELPYPGEIEAAFSDTLMQIDEERRSRAWKEFERVMTQPGPVATWTECRELPVWDPVAQQAFYSDLLVLGQDSPANENPNSLPIGFVQDVLIACGRPALVLPYIGWSRPIGETVVIAWKETPEAARAVKAAMPFLQRAARVHVLAWGEERGVRIGGDALNLERYLRLHGVQVEWHREGLEPPGGPGEMLLSRLSDLGADLLVMGCYGHGRAREWILGGVSRTMLGSMTVPVLLVH